jgi:hypothetical protein
MLYCQRRRPELSLSWRPVFWDAEGCTVIDFLPRKEVVSAVHYIPICTLWQALMKRHIILQYACPHTVHLMVAKVEKLAWEVLPCPPYSAGVTLSCCHLFRPLKII